MPPPEASERRRLLGPLASCYKPLRRNAYVFAVDSGSVLRRLREAKRTRALPTRLSYNQNLWMHHLIVGAAYLPR